MLLENRLKKLKDEEEKNLKKIAATMARTDRFQQI